MVSATAWWQFTNGEQVGVSVEIDESFPDAADQAVVECASMLIRAMVARRQMVEDGDELD